MGQTLSYQDAEYRPARVARRNPNPTPKTRGRKSSRALVKVPVLDWSAQLFSDNATAAELMEEDFAFPCGPSFISPGQELAAQAA